MTAVLQDAQRALFVAQLRPGQIRGHWSALSRL